MFTATLEVVFTDTDFELLPTKRILTNNNKQHNKLKYKNDNSTDDTVFVTVSMDTSHTVLPLSLCSQEPRYEGWGCVVLSSFLFLASPTCFLTRYLDNCSFYVLHPLPLHQAFFMNNFFDVPELLPASKSNNKTYTSKDTKPGSHSKSTDDLQFKSAKLWPNLRPKVDAEVFTIDGGDIFASATKDEPKSTVVQWELPIDDIEEGKKYKFDVKLKVGPNVDSKEILMVDWEIGTDDLSGASEIVVK